jgi:hypothetical protein
MIGESTKKEVTECKYTSVYDTDDDGNVTALIETEYSVKDVLGPNIFRYKIAMTVQEALNHATKILYLVAHLTEKNANNPS